MCSSSGRKCSTLRRLWKEAKLSKDETDLLERLNFRFVSFDDIYYEADFDDMLTRLEQYECETKNNYQVPKKYASDVELGAWVANVRRLGPNKLFPEHSIKLESLKFSWKSTRKCGSSFMSRYREVQKRVEGFKKSIERERDVVREENSVRGNDSNAIATDSDLSKWMAAQKEAWKKGNLSEARVQYLDQLTEFGFDWKTDKF